MQLELPKPTAGSSEKIEEEFTVARLYISKMKSEVKTLTQHCGQLEAYEKDTKEKLVERQSELDECRLLIQQHEAKISSTQQSMREVEGKKSRLEETVDGLNEEIARLKAEGELLEDCKDVLTAILLSKATLHCIRFCFNIAPFNDLFTT